MVLQRDSLTGAPGFRVPRMPEQPALEPEGRRGLRSGSLFSPALRFRQRLRGRPVCPDTRSRRTDESDPVTPDGCDRNEVAARLERAVHDCGGAASTMHATRRSVRRRNATAMDSTTHVEAAEGRFRFSTTQRDRRQQAAESGAAVCRDGGCTGQNLRSHARRPQQATRGRDDTHRGFHGRHHRRQDPRPRLHAPARSHGSRTSTAPAL